MNKAYKQFLKDSLTDYCATNGIDIDGIIEQIEFRAAHPMTINDENGNERTVAEPNAYEYAEANDTYIVSALDRNSLKNENVNIKAIDNDNPNAVSAILSNWRDECCNEFNEASGDIIDWSYNLETAFDNADMDFDTYQIAW